jgi:dienelactone hydrolase
MIWNLSKLAKTPEMSNASGFEDINGIKAIFYDGLKWNDKPTKAFAWIGVPERKGDEKLPAMVLIHGGGGTAFHEWVSLWNQRGYAAIAMDLCGCVPKGEYGNWNRHENGGPPGWGGFDQIDWETENQWTYHAISDIILAHSLIASFPEVDSNRVGMTGISWGGYLTCIASGVDNRFKFAVPVYGCGYLGINSCWLPTFQQIGEDKAKKWLDLWDPSIYLKDTTMPMLWVTGTNDFAYPLDSVQDHIEQQKATILFAYACGCRMVMAVWVKIQRRFTLTPTTISKMAILLQKLQIMELRKIPYGQNLTP